MTTRAILIPNRSGTGVEETLQLNGNLVIVGANGSGKSRLGYWIENANHRRFSVHRISAQRVLNLPDYAEIRNLPQAEKGLLYGSYSDSGSIDRKIHDRWGSTPATYLLNDYSHLLSTLFARTATRDSQHAHETRLQKAYVPVADAPIDVIVNVWNEIMPHRAISFEEGRVLTKISGQPPYHGKEMSDGERVALYLIGQSLCTPNNSIVIIDEPEIHLHKSLMSRLWNVIEGLCPNKTFIYITHDLDFAASRKESIKIWTKSFDGVSSWQWELVPEIDEIPDNLTVEILGNRRNVVFTEGDRGSLDTTLYQAVYEEFHIIPRGGCDKVIESTKAMNSNPSLHHLKALGIVDMDYRNSSEINSLNKAGIHAIKVAEVENLFCIEPVMQIAAEVIKRDSVKVVKDVTEFIRKCLKEELETQISNHAEREVQFRLNSFTKQAQDEKGLSDGMKTMLAGIDIAKIYGESKKLFENALTTGKLDELLLIYNRKNMARRIAGFFGFKDSEYIDFVLRLLKSEKKTAIVAALKRYLPNLA